MAEGSVQTQTDRGSVSRNSNSEEFLFIDTELVKEEQHEDGPGMEVVLITSAHIPLAGTQS